jgi:hypothetical protein
MAAVPYHFTTAASTNLQTVRAGQTANLKGYEIMPPATAIFIKLYWMLGGVAPTVGTTVPNLTIGTIASTPKSQSFPDGITGNGQLWVAVTGAVSDGDSSNATAAGVITLLVE